ncbi:CDP-glycerol glycerophosphotransferase family protein [Lachnospiraceae bacterium JLR.KK008]
MNLCKLTDDNLEFLSGKKVYCYEYSSSYMDELAHKFAIADSIEAVIDDNARNQGEHRFGEKKIAVYGSGSLSEIPLDTAVFLITSDYFREAFDVLSGALEERGYGEDIYYFENYETEVEMAYRDRYENTGLENVIVFRSGPHASAYVAGMDFSDNARALFEFMLNKRYNNKYKLVWFVKHPQDFSAYQAVPNVEFLSFDWALSEEEEERERYYRALCLAKYLFFTDAYGFARNCRSDQVRVQLWHGCGFKTRVNFIRCEKRYEYTTVVSEIYSRIHQDIYGLREDQVLITGYAKEDWLFSPVADFVERLSLPAGRKYIFWLPTFRMAREGLDSLNEYELGGQTGLPIVDTIDKCRALNDLLHEEQAVLLVKLHPFQDRLKIADLKMENIVLLDNQELVGKDIQINQLLGCADAMISDYSSAAVDYMILDRPLAFTLDDVEEYGSSRGFVFDNIRDWLPGVELYNFDDFCRFVRETAAGLDLSGEKRRALLRKMHRYGDNRNCERIAEALGI